MSGPDLADTASRRQVCPPEAQHCPALPPGAEVNVRFSDFRLLYLQVRAYSKPAQALAARREVHVGTEVVKPEINELGL